jgi:hypothetical protein
MTGGRRAALRRLAEVAGALASVTLVFTAAAVLLYAVDAVPALITGEPRHVRRASTVVDVERRLRARLLVPYYFPKTLVWPPQRIRFVVGPPGAAALWVDARDGGPRLLVAETLGPGAIPARLIPEAQVIHSSPVAVGPARGTLSRVVDEGAMAWQITWVQDGRTLLLRSRGTVEELVRIARSVREEQ